MEALLSYPQYFVFGETPVSKQVKVVTIIRFFCVWLEKVRGEDAHIWLDDRDIHLYAKSGHL